MESISFPVTSKPGERCRIDLDQQSCLRISLPSAMRLIAPSFFRRRQSVVFKQAVQRSIGDRDTVLFIQDLPKMREARVGKTRILTNGEDSVAEILRERSKPTANAGPAPGGGHKVGKDTMILLSSHSSGICRDHAMRAARREPRRGESPMRAEEQVCRLMNFPGNRGSLSGVSGTNRKNSDIFAG